jgi:hypothetical protein
MPPGSSPLYEEYVRRFPPAPRYAPDDVSFEARYRRLLKQTQGSEPYDFTEVMEWIYAPGPGQMFIDHSIVEYDGQLWVFHIVGRPEDLERTDPRIRKLKYEYTGYATGTTLFDLVYQGLILDRPQGDWDAIATGIPVAVARFRDGFVAVYTGVGLAGTKNGVAFSDDLVHWQPHPRNPVLPPPPWAKQYGACKDPHILRYDGKYLIYYRVDAKDGNLAIALAVTEDWDHFAFLDPVWLAPGAMRGTSGIESPCVVEREGIFHLFYCCGQGTWHAVSDTPYKWTGARGQYLLGPFIAAEVFLWRGEWWFSSTKKEELRRRDRLNGISNHSEVGDEQRNLAGMFLAHIRWEGDFPVLEKPGKWREMVALPQ